MRTVSTRYALFAVDRFDQAPHITDGIESFDRVRVVEVLVDQLRKMIGTSDSLVAGIAIGSDTFGHIVLAIVVERFIVGAPFRRR